jgi:hypothetical protein
MPTRKPVRLKGKAYYNDDGHTRRINGGRDSHTLLINEVDEGTILKTPIYLEHHPPQIGSINSVKINGNSIDIEATVDPDHGHYIADGYKSLSIGYHSIGMTDMSGNMIRNTKVIRDISLVKTPEIAECGTISVLINNSTQKDFNYQEISYGIPMSAVDNMDIVQPTNGQQTSTPTQPPVVQNQPTNGTQNPVNGQPVVAQNPNVSNSGATQTPVDNTTQGTPSLDPAIAKKFADLDKFTPEQHKMMLAQISLKLEADAQESAKKTQEQESLKQAEAKKLQEERTAKAQNLTKKHNITNPSIVQKLSENPETLDLFDTMDKYHEKKFEELSQSLLGYKRKIDEITEENEKAKKAKSNEQVQKDALQFNDAMNSYLQQFGIKPMPSLTKNPQLSGPVQQLGMPQGFVQQEVVVNNSGTKSAEAIKTYNRVAASSDNINSLLSLQQTTKHEVEIMLRNSGYGK